MWIWPVWKFWTFSPLGWVLAVMWNLSEYIKKPLPFAGWAFGIICGSKGKKVS